MSGEFKIEIVNPEKSFLVKEDVSEVVVPAFEGEMGILRDHISIISFLKPGIIKVSSKSGDEMDRGCGERCTDLRAVHDKTGLWQGLGLGRHCMLLPSGRCQGRLF